MLYLVNNIKINEDKPFDTKLPVVLSEPCLAQVFFRSGTFYTQEVTFDFEPLNAIRNEFTQCISWNHQDWSADVSDANYQDYVDCTVTPMHASRCVVAVTNEELKDCDDDLKQAIFEQLMHCLPVTFIYRMPKAKDIILD